MNCLSSLFVVCYCGWCYLAFILLYAILIVVDIVQCYLNATIRRFMVC